MKAFWVVIGYYNQPPKDFVLSVRNRREAESLARRMAKETGYVTSAAKVYTTYFNDLKGMKKYKRS